MRATRWTRGGRLTFTLSNVTLDAAYASLHADVLEGQYVLLTITDTGHGMERDVIDQIFEPFFTHQARRRGDGPGPVHGLRLQSARARATSRCTARPAPARRLKFTCPVRWKKLAEPPAGLTGPVLGGGETILVGGRRCARAAHGGRHAARPGLRRAACGRRRLGAGPAGHGRGHRPAVYGRGHARSRQQQGAGAAGPAAAAGAGRVVYLGLYAQRPSCRVDGWTRAWSC